MKGIIEVMGISPLTAFLSCRMNEETLGWEEWEWFCSLGTNSSYRRELLFGCRNLKDQRATGERHAGEIKAAVIKWEFPPCSRLDQSSENSRKSIVQENRYRGYFLQAGGCSQLRARLWLRHGLLCGRMRQGHVAMGDERECHWGCAC